jgi:hypothetical protein
MTLHVVFCNLPEKKIRSDVTYHVSAKFNNKLKKCPVAKRFMNANLWRPQSTPVSTVRAVLVT